MIDDGLLNVRGDVLFDVGGDGLLNDDGTTEALPSARSPWAPFIVCIALPMTPNVSLTVASRAPAVSQFT